MASGCRSMPFGHRRKLYREQVDFQRWIKSQYRYSPWKTKRVQNAVVQPFQDLLNKPSGGEAYCGGVIFGDVQIRSTLSHFRARRAIDRPLYKLEAGQLPLIKVTSRQFWCGPLSFHFGHQIADFGSRVLLSSLDPRGGELLWCPWRAGDDWESLDPWQQFLLNYLNPGQKAHRFCTRPLQIRELVVIPQQARMHSAPTPEHLHALSWCQKILNPKTYPIVYVSRSKFAPCTSRKTLLGSFAGEVLFENYLMQRGVQIIYPESLSLKEQLEIYLGASVLIFSEGSAQHGLELLGFNASKEVVIICRRRQKPGMHWPLTARFPNVQFIQAVASQWKAENGVDWNGLAILSWRDVLSSLNKYFDTPFSEVEISELEIAADCQLKQLLDEVDLEQVF